MKEVLKAYNQFNYTVLALEIDHDSKTATLYKSGRGPIHADKKTSQKKIKETANFLKSVGYTVAED